MVHELPEIQRQAFITALETAVAQSRAEGVNIGLLLIDIANLTQVNHVLGYPAGDGMLAQACHHLLSISKLPDTVFRIGSHQFAFILPGLTNPAFISLAMNRIQRLLEEELAVEADQLAPEIRIGLSVNLEGHRDALAVLALAEASLAHAKLGGQYRLEDLIGEDAEVMRDLSLEPDFRDARYDNAFELHFQPQGSSADGSGTSAEALLRWMPPGRDPVPPEMVLQLADDAGKGYELTKWVVHRTLRQLRDWRDGPGVRLALNIQPNMVNNPDLAGMLKDSLRIWGVPPDQLTVEITESGIIEDKESGFDNLLSLRKQGINMAIDDFGTGYSSLSYFKQIPATELKIDRSFVSRILEEPLDLELVKAIIHLAHQFGLSVVAEGVEDEETLTLLRELNCDYVQGYYFSPPLPASEFVAWLDDYRRDSQYTAQAWAVPRKPVGYYLAPGNQGYL